MERIATTRRIASKGIIVLELAGNKPAIVRNANQFVQDLKNSFLVADSVESIQHPQVTKALRQLRKGYVDGDITFHKKGEKWIVTENSRVITDEAHPDYGTVAVGDTQEYKSDQTRVEGFLDLELNDKAELNREKAEALAEAELALAKIFTSTKSDNDTSQQTEDVVDALDDFSNGEMEQESDN